MKKIIIFITLTISTLTFSQEQTETVKGKIQSETSKSILQNVHVLNLTKVKGTISNSKGEFEVKANVNDTLYFSYIGYKSLKVIVTNDLIRFDDNTIEITELAFALEEIIVKPYQLTGYLEIDVKNAPVNTSARYKIVGLPNLGYEAGRRSRSGISKIIGAIFNPADFLNNLFKKKSARMDKLRLMREDEEIKNLLSIKFDREVLVQL
ncbi:MAG: carboxypeptidase-like regulatory domain-containing protein, partial [Cryomorphaceae bacterium]|nr:carboxypeptidase-like regulatory domain-containing protein [Cryomorphaceae bacterium]MBT4222744.1 carboxypeptidase-like regulatory domain-containing protein [Cryomorphaceae bacterium]MBT6214496.1 carboxypeptidase-like regulatory domain-containing protein [Cryomorphaceae bacterium]